MMFDHIIQGWVLEFYEKGDTVIKTICSLVVPTEIVVMKYQFIQPIPEDQRPELILYAKEMFPEKTDEEIEKVIKVVHTIGVLL